MSTPRPEFPGPAGPFVHAHHPPGGRRKRSSWRAVLILALVLLVPVAEVLVLVATGRAIGVGWTFGVLLVLSLLGVWLIRHEGRATWRALRDAVNTGRMPAKESADAALVLIGGFLLLLPGFLTDVLGLLLILPFTRPLARTALQRGIERRVASSAGIVRSVTVVDGSVVDDRTGPRGPDRRGGPMRLIPPHDHR